MPGPKKILILGGTTESAALAGQVTETFGERVEAITSLAGRLSSRRTLPGRVRVGGFGGVDGLVEFFKSEKIDAVVDATHPFAAIISAHAYDACLLAEVPRVMLIRPPWQPEPTHPWVEAVDLGDAAALLPKMSKRAFLTIGRQGLDAFANVKGVWLLVRLIEPPADALLSPDHLVITGRPPHSIEDEMALMREHRIDTLVCKQSGGAVTESKLIAAHRIGVHTVMISRPLPEPGPTADSVAAAIGWIEQQL